MYPKWILKSTSMGPNDSTIGDHLQQMGHTADPFEGPMPWALKGDPLDGKALKWNSSAEHDAGHPLAQRPRLQGPLGLKTAKKTGSWNPKTSFWRYFGC